MTQEYYAHIFIFLFNIVFIINTHFILFYIRACVEHGQCQLMKQRMCSNITEWISLAKIFNIIDMGLMSTGMPTHSLV